MNHGWVNGHADQNGGGSVYGTDRKGKFMLISDRSLRYCWKIQRDITQKLRGQAESYTEIRRCLNRQMGQPSVQNGSESCRGRFPAGFSGIVSIAATQNRL
jgi:hypothetical protein